jgi:hypothetical protein
MADPTRVKLRTGLRLGGFLGFIGGFLMAYQQSSCEFLLEHNSNPNQIFSHQKQVRFWGWSENAREQEMDMAELSQRIKDGKSLYGESDQPAHVQASAYRNSAFSQLKFRECGVHLVIHD